VGACARVARNTGCAGLDLVAPGEWRTVECWRSAWGAHELLEEARVFESLAAALAGAALTVAFTGRRRAARSAVDVRDAAAEVASLAREDVASLVFGPETSGLSNGEVALCGRAAVIPAHPAQPSYNLSHAVAIAAYEVQRAGRPPGEGARRRVTHGEKEALLASLREGLLAIRALPAANTEGYFSDWRTFVQRVDLTPKERKLLEHMARKMARAGGGG
jgi:TrmH family RNA methyltransferase